MKVVPLIYRFPEFLAKFCSVTSSDYKYVKIRSICVKDGNQQSKGARVISGAPALRDALPCWSKMAGP